MRAIVKHNSELLVVLKQNKIKPGDHSHNIDDLSVIMNLDLASGYFSVLMALVLYLNILDSELYI